MPDEETVVTPEVEPEVSHDDLDPAEEQVPTPEVE
jgi:hypothetical protein